jgi:hypothetical protein
MNRSVGACVAFASMALGITVATAGEPDATRLADLLDSYRALAPASSGFAAAAGETLEIGRLTLSLQDGAL